MSSFLKIKTKKNWKIVFFGRGFHWIKDSFKYKYFRTFEIEDMHVNLLRTLVLKNLWIINNLLPAYSNPQRGSVCCESLLHWCSGRTWPPLTPHPCGSWQTVPSTPHRAPGPPTQILASQHKVMISGSYFTKHTKTYTIW